MLICDYKQRGDLSLAEAQFIIAIAIDYAGFHEAAVQVLKLFTSNTANSRAKEMTRETQLEQKIKESRYGMVAGFIHALFHDNIINISSGGRYNREQYVNLSDLHVQNISNLTEELLYRDTMQLVSMHQVDSFILLYMQTDMWYNIFKNIAVPRNRKPNDDIIIQLNSAFQKEYIALYSSSGQYNPATRTPQAFLIHAYDWFKTKETYRRIINNKSVLSGTGEEDSRSLLDLNVDGNDIAIEQTMTNYKYAEGINFIEIARKIYEASISMFHHGQEPTAYYDIVSWYKSYLAAQIKDEKQKQLNSLKDLYDIEFIGDVYEISAERRKKKEVRCAVCRECFLDVLENGFAIEDIYPFYCKVAETQFERAGRTDKDGKLMYSYGGFKTKEDNDARTFQKQYEGFLALRELLEYLKSPQNDLNLTIFDIPIDIFRDSRYLKRFKSLHEYIYLFKDVQLLLAESDSSYERKQIISPSGVYLNDYVYTQIDEAITRASDVNSLLNKLKDVSLTPSNDRLYESEVDKVTRLIKEPLLEFITKVKQDRALTLREQNINYLIECKLNTAEQLIAYITKTSLEYCCIMINNGCSMSLRVNAALAVLNMIEFLFMQLGNPIEVNGSFAISGNIENDLQQLGIPNSEFQLTLNGKTGTYKFRDTLVTAVNVAVTVLNTPDKDLRNSFNIARIMNGVFIKIEQCCSNILKAIKDASEKHSPNFYLCYAKVLYENEIINLDFPVKDFFTLNQFSDRNYIVESVDYSDSVQMYDISRKKKETTDSILQSINEKLEYFVPLFKIMSQFRAQAVSTLKVTGNAVGGISKRRYKKLLMLNAKICTEKEKLQYADEISTRAKRATFSLRNNYLLHNNDYVMLAGKYHVHAYGYKVSTGTADELYHHGLNQDIEPEILPLDDADINNLRLTWGN